MLENLGASEAAVLGDVTDEDCGDVLALRGEEKLRSRLANLPDAAGSRLELQREDRLDRVNDHEARLQPDDFLEDALDTRFRQQVQRGRPDAESVTAALDLMLGLLARRVEHRPD